MQFDQKNYGNLTLLVSLENQGTKSQKTPWKTHPHGSWSIRKLRVLGIPMAYPLGNPMGVEKLILNPWWDLN